MGLIVAGTASTGGLAAALALKLIRKKNAAEDIAPNLNKRRIQNVNEND
jgi:hypothetical protein